MDPSAISSVFTAAATFVITLGGAVVLWYTKVSKTRSEGVESIYKGYQALQAATLGEIEAARQERRDSRTSMENERKETRVWMETVMQKEREFFAAEIARQASATDRRSSEIAEAVRTLDRHSSEQHAAIVETLKLLCQGCNSQK